MLDKLIVLLSLAGVCLAASGCTDPEASNYWKDATSDNGNCIYPRAKTGCTDIMANNYDAAATQGEPATYCTYNSGVTPTDPAYCGKKDPSTGMFYSKENACSEAGLYTPYGKFCAKAYTGCLGEQPADELDSCCQAHDDCIGQHGFLECYCNVRLLECVKYAAQVGGGGFCGKLQAAAHTIARDLAVLSVCPCSDLSQMECSECTAAHCKYCPADGTCHSLLNVLAKCDDPFIKNGQCPASQTDVFREAMFMQSLGVLDE